MGAQYGMRPSVEIIAERLFLARGLGAGVNEHELGAARLQLLDGQVGSLEGRYFRPVDEQAPEHVGNAHGYIASLENAKAQPWVLFAEVGGTHYPVLFSEELFVSIGVEGMVPEGEEVGYGEQGGAALAGDTTTRRGRVLGVGDDGVRLQLST